MKVRLYHLATEWDLPATAILETLHEHGHRDIKNHFVTIDEEDIPGLRDMLYDAGLFEEDEAPEASAPAEAEPADEGAPAPAAVEAPAAESVPEPVAPAAAEPVAESAPEPVAPVVAAPVAPVAPVVVAPVAAAPPAGLAAAQSEADKARKKKPPKPEVPGAPVGVAPTFRGFAPGFDPNARRVRREGGGGGGGGGGVGGPRGSGDRPGDGPRGSSLSSLAERGGLEMLSSGGPLDPNARKRAGAKAGGLAASKRGQRTAARRPGAHGGQGRGRRLERRMQEMDRWRKTSRKPRRPKARTSSNAARPDQIQIQLPISLKDLSATLAIRMPEMIGFLMKQGLMINATQPIPEEAIEMIGLNWNIDIALQQEVLAEHTVQEIDAAEDDAQDLEPRQPVVAVLGHVDHGKTSLLDYIRKTKKPVADKEAGGITQHIGAYVATHKGQKITFIDTPGHAAFTEMRARGANVTDMVLLVVAADDGVMPQTKEAIQHAQAANVEIIVAVNKMDKKGSSRDKTLQGLTQIDGMLPSEYGGQIDVVGCSAKTGQGVDELLDTILVHAEVHEFKANPKKSARGTVLEAKKTIGQGIVVTLLVEDGTLNQGDTVLCGKTSGKIRRMNDDNGKALKKATPGTPVEVIGIEDVPEAGERFYVLSDAEAKKIIAERKEQALKAKSATGMDHIPTDQNAIWKVLAEQELKEVNVVLKADVSGSLQVLKRELGNLSTEEVRCRVIRDGVGGISHADVLLAAASNAVVIGFGVSADAKARAMAKERQVDIRTYRVIYELIDGVKEIMAGQLEPDEVEHVIGQVSVRKLFKSSKVGMIAGCFVESGLVRRNSIIRLARDGIILWQGPMDSLRRFSEDVKEVRENFECGIKLRGYDDLHEGDTFEVVEIEQVARTL